MLYKNLPFMCNFESFEVKSCVHVLPPVDDGRFHCVHGATWRVVAKLSISGPTVCRSISYCSSLNEAVVRFYFLPGS